MWEIKGEEVEVEEEAGSLLCKVRSDGEAGRPECGHAENGLDGGPRAAEDGVPLPVIQLHKGLLGDRDRQLIGLATNMCSSCCVRPVCIS